MPARERCAAWNFRPALKLNMPSLEGENHWRMFHHEKRKSRSNIANNTSYKLSGSAPQGGGGSFMNCTETFVNIPAVEGTASRPCPFEASPACSLDICAGEAMCMAGLEGKARPLAVGWSRHCWTCCTAASAS